MNVTTRFNTVPRPDYDFGSDRLKVYGLRAGTHVDINVNDSGVTVETPAGVSLADVFPFLAKHLKGLHTKFATTRAAGLTASQHAAFKTGLHIVGYIENRGYEDEFGLNDIDTLDDFTSDEVALCIITAIPTSVASKGRDSIDFNTRYNHMVATLRAAGFDRTPDDICPLVRPMQLLNSCPWYPAGGTVSSVWDRVSYLVIRAGFYKALCVDPYAPWVKSEIGVFALQAGRKLAEQHKQISEEL